MRKTESKDVLHEPETGFERRYSERLRLYEGVREIARDLSPPNKAIVLIAGICVCAIWALAKVEAPWYAYVCVMVLSTKYSALVVWREKNVKSKHTDSS